MRVPTTYSWIAIVAGMCLATPAAAQSWSDDLESYASGSGIEGQGGWRGWDGVTTAFSVVSQAFAFDGQQSLSTTPGADTIREYTGIVSGVWVLEVQQYIPTGLVGRSDINLMNLYQDFGPYEWSSQITFNGTTNLVECWCGATTSTDIPLVYDQWMEVRWEMDFDLDQVSFYYGGTLVGTYAWSTGPFGDQSFTNLELQAIDLYPYPSSSGAVYYDAWRLRPLSLGSNYCSSNANSTGSPAVISLTGSDSVALADLRLTSEPVPNQPGIFFYAPSQIEVPFGNGFLCISGGIVRLPVVVASGNTVSYTLDFGSLPAAGQINPGDTWNFQHWMRDPAGGGTFFNTSNAVSLLFIP